MVEGTEQLNKKIKEKKKKQKLKNRNFQGTMTKISSEFTK